ncbi:MAG: aspartate--tRNA ligase [Endomicrobium sp.]|jgi:aspartyl-tRNA synthetase|nr:aspartate--tRNA ligase [Endomicrobium sp.]
MKQRSEYCGKLGINSIGKQVNLYGWVNSYRNHGGLIFIDLRDIEGLIQIVIEPNNKKAFKTATELRNEYVISVTGLVRQRPKGTVNYNIRTGNIEVVVLIINILNTAKNLPISISDKIDCSEELRLKYRYLDLRRPKLQKHFILRSYIAKIVRDFLSEENFLEIETPILTKSTPEGARDFLVPSRIYNGQFFALPQSPQLFKQILMVAGFDKYYQIVKCFRDEDLRADRQLEFTQIDLEMSFIDERHIMNIIEKMICRIFKTVLNINIDIPFKQITYEYAMLKYGSDKPDLRFKMEIYDFSNEFKYSKFVTFKSTILQGGIVRGLCIPNGCNLANSAINNMIKFVNKYGAKGLSWLKITSTGATSHIVKYLTKQEINNLVVKCNAKIGDLLIFIADKDESIVIKSLGALRVSIANELKLINPNKFNFTWIIDFPLMQWSQDEHKWQSFHHPFTSPKNDMELFSIQDINIKKIKSKAYDIILNGIELGGGSIRIHKNTIQKKVFDMLQIPHNIAKKKFGFLLEALSYGAPPHGGIALGLDRLCSLIFGTQSIRDVIAFPKTQNAIDLMSNSPSHVTDEQLQTLGIRFR